MPTPHLKNLVRKWKRMNGYAEEGAARGADAAVSSDDRDEAGEHAVQEDHAAVAEPAERQAEPLVVRNEPMAPVAEPAQESDVDVSDAAEDRVGRALDHNHNRHDQRPMQQEDVVERHEPIGNVPMGIHWYPVNQPLEFLENRSDERPAEGDQEEEPQEVENGSEAQEAHGGPKGKKLGPCAVCGAQSAGFHFGAFTCEGCKSFYGRYNNKEKPVCDKEGNCNIRLELRRTCRGCRYKKCLEVNMDRSNSQFGRRPANFQYSDPGPSTIPADQGMNSAAVGQPAIEENCEPKMEEEQKPVKTEQGQGQEQHQEGQLSEHQRREVEIQQHEKRLRLLQAEARRLEEQERRLHEQLRREQELREQERQLHEQQLRREQEERQLEEQRRRQEWEQRQPRQQEEVRLQQQRRSPQDLPNNAAGRRFSPYDLPLPQLQRPAFVSQAAARPLLDPQAAVRPLLDAQAAAGPRLPADMVRFFHQQLLTRQLQPPLVQLPQSPPLEAAGLQLPRRSPAMEYMLSPQSLTPSPHMSPPPAHQRAFQMELPQLSQQLSPPQLSPPQAHQRTSPTELPQLPQIAPQGVPLQLSRSPQLSHLQWGVPREEQLQLPGLSPPAESQQLPYIAHFAVRRDPALVQLPPPPMPARLPLPPQELAKALDVNRNMPMPAEEMWRQLLERCPTCGQIPIKCYCDNPPIDLSAGGLGMPRDIGRR